MRLAKSLLRGWKANTHKDYRISGYGMLMLSRYCHPHSLRLYIVLIASGFNAICDQMGICPKVSKSTSAAIGVDGVIQWIFAVMQKGELMNDLISREAVYMANEHLKPCSPKDVEDMISCIPSARQWIPCSERLPEEDHWLGGSGRQFSDNVLISILNSDDEDEWVDVSHTIDGEWVLELPRHCKILAWMPLPHPYREVSEK